MSAEKECYREERRKMQSPGLGLVCNYKWGQVPGKEQSQRRGQQVQTPCGRHIPDVSSKKARKKPLRVGKQTHNRHE